MCVINISFKIIKILRDKIDIRQHHHIRLISQTKSMMKSSHPAAVRIRRKTIR